jgi:nucleoside-diphosphate-sugar epimerase
MSGAPTRVGDVPAAYRGARALVLGGSGFVGRWVARALTRSGATVLVAVRDATTFPGIAETWRIDAEVISMEALDESSISRAVRDADPDIVFNLIGYGVDRAETQPDLMWRVNRDLVRQAATALARLSSTRAWPHGPRFIHVGSALEYGRIEGVAKEDGPVEPHTEYGRSKLAGALALRDVALETGLIAVTARAFTVFGPGEHPGRLLPTILRAAREGAIVRLSAGSQLRDFCYVEDVADGLLRLGIAAASRGEVVNLATGRLIPVREFAETAARVLGVPADRLQFGMEPLREDEMRITGVDTERLEALTGWRPPADLERGLARAAGFEQGGA